METMTQAEFARAHGVSRAAVTQWKNRGYLVFSGNRVDVAATNRRLRAARQEEFGRRQPVKRGGRCGLAVDTRHVNSVRDLAADPTGLHPLISSLAIIASTAPADVAALLLPLLPAETVRDVVERLAVTLCRSVVELLEDDDIVPPAPCATWAEHPAFMGPHVTAAEWSELVREAGHGH